MVYSMPPPRIEQLYVGTLRFFDRSSAGSMVESASYVANNLRYEYVQINNEHDPARSVWGAGLML